MSAKTTTDEMLTDEALRELLRDEEWAALEEMKALDDEGVCARFSDRFLMRFVFGRKLDAQRALDMLRSHVEWRKQWRIEELDANAVRDYFEMQFTEWCPTAYDREGRGVQFFWPRNCDLNALVERRTQRGKEKQDKKRLKQERKQQRKREKLAKKQLRQQSAKAQPESGEMMSSAAEQVTVDLQREHAAEAAHLEAHLIATQRAQAQAAAHSSATATATSVAKRAAGEPEELDLMTQFIWSSYYVSDLAMEHDLTLQREGFVIVEDFAGASLLRNFRFPKEFDMKHAFEGIQDNVPGRMRRIYIVNAPWYMSLLMKLIKPFAKSKMLSKVTLVSTKELAQFISPEHLPPSLGGTLQFDYQAFIDEQIAMSAGRLSEGERQRAFRSIP